MTRLSGRFARDIWWFLLVLLIGNTAVAGYGIYRSSQEQASVSHTFEVTATINALLSCLVDTETAVRGFVIAGEQAYLVPYYDSQPQINAQVTHLHALTEDNDHQQDNLAVLDRLVPQRLETLRQLISARQSPERNIAREVEMVAAGKSEMDPLRDRLQLMQDEETKILKTRQKTALFARNAALFATALSGLVAVGVLALANRLIRRDDLVRRENETVLRNSEERFRLMAESLPQLIWVTNPKGQHIFHNRQWSEYTGHARDESTSLPWGSLLHPNDRERTEWRWQTAVNNGEPFEAEYRLRRHDGTYRWFLSRAIPQRDQSGAIVRWFGSSTDIDDQKQAKQLLEEQVRERTAELRQVVDNLHVEAAESERANERLRVATVELTRSNSELEQFAYVASHDLQEPLRKIQAFGDRLKTRFGDQFDHDGTDYIERMQTSATRMRRLIDDLLRFSRVTTKAMPATSIDLNILVSEAVADLDDSIVRTGGSITVGPMPKIVADQSQMRQLFQNLLSNALKFHKPGEPPVVAVRAEMLPRLPNEPPESPDRPAVRIEVTDQGIGFEPAYSQRIFQVFQRLHGRNEYEGTGIGLAVVKKIAERHGGTVSAASSPGNGATFSVVLPLEPIATDDAGPRSGTNLTR